MSTDHTGTEDRRFLSSASFYPKRPVRYIFVRLSTGRLNRLSALPDSTTSPPRKKAISSATLAACCILWVTMTMVMRSRRLFISSSMLRVETGSKAEVGSSSNSTSGSTARALAMHSRCCCPPDSPRAGFFSLSFTSSKMAAPRRACSTIPSSCPLSLTPWSLGP